jgi:hypothetical protein
MTADTKEQALNKLIAVACTCKRRNTPEWMAYFAECINKAIEASGSDDRVEWPGSWSNEFHLISGA